VAGDLPLVQWLAGVYGYQLNPNDVNGIYCKSGCSSFFIDLDSRAGSAVSSSFVKDWKTPISDNVLGQITGWNRLGATTITRVES
jgi:hypothetical protein